MIRHAESASVSIVRPSLIPTPAASGANATVAQPPCRQASKAASQRRWLRKPDNRDYFSGPTHVERVRQWRQAHPGYWRRKAAQAALMRYKMT